MAVWNKNNLGFYLPVVLNNRRKFYVDATSGNDSNTGKQAGAAWQTIAAVNAYADFIMGDRVLFKRGETWNERLLPPKSGLLFADYGAGALPIIDGQDTRDCIDVNHQSGLVFQNLDLRHGLDYGVLVSGVHDIGIIGCTVHGCGNDNILISDDCYNVRITNCTSYEPYERVAGPVISCLEIADDCYNVVVDGCTLYGSAAVGLAIHAHDLETVPWDVHILNTTIRNNTTFGLQVLRIDGAINHATLAGIEIKNCTIRDNTSRGINVSKSGTATAYPSNVTIDSCVVRDNTASSTYQIEIHGSGHTLIRSLVSGITYRAAGFAHVQSLTVQNNTFYVQGGSAYVGVVVFTDSSNNGVNFRNNIIAAALTTILCIQVQTNAGTNFVYNYNLFYTPSGASANRWSWNGGANTTWANWKSQSSQDANSPAPANPNFTDAANDDFTLQAGSPAIDAGTVITGVTDGYLGAAPDCGAYEKA